MQLHSCSHLHNPKPACGIFNAICRQEILTTPGELKTNIYTQIRKMSIPTLYISIQAVTPTKYLLFWFRRDETSAPGNILAQTCCCIKQGQAFNATWDEYASRIQQVSYIRLPMFPSNQPYFFNLYVYKQPYLLSCFMTITGGNWLQWIYMLFTVYIIAKSSNCACL